MSNHGEIATGSPDRFLAAKIGPGTGQAAEPWLLVSMTAIISGSYTPR